MTDCLFCKIAAREIPSSIVLEQDRVLAFRDIAPAAPTHVLVIPKEHVADARALGAGSGSGDLLAELVEAANAVADAEGIGSSGYRLVFNVGPDAGQTVFHLHLHVLGGRALGAMGPGA